MTVYQKSHEQKSHEIVSRDVRKAPDCAIQTVLNRACKPSFVHAAQAVPDAAVNVRWSNLAGRRPFSRDAEKRTLRGMVSQPFGFDAGASMATFAYPQFSSRLPHPTNIFG